jgi:hypothetical protein
MPKPRLPALPTMTALMLLVTIPVAITFTGPIPIRYDILKDFQPTIAALVALGAAIAAYSGAMARAKFDREIDRRQRAKEKIGLYLRLISQLNRLQHDAFFTSQFLDESIQRGKKDTKEWKVEWTADVLTLSGDFNEVEEAWQNIELLPVDAFEKLDRVRQLLQTLQQVAENNKAATHVEYIEARTYLMKLDRLSTTCGSVTKIVQDNLDHIAPLDYR